MNEQEYHEQLRIENEVLRRTLANMNPGEGKPKFEVDTPGSSGNESDMKKQYIAALRQQEEDEYLRF